MARTRGATNKKAREHKQDAVISKLKEKNVKLKEENRELKKK